MPTGIDRDDRSGGVRQVRYARHYRLRHVVGLDHTLQGRCRGSSRHHLLGAARHEPGMDQARRYDDNADLGSEHPSQCHAHCVKRRL